MVMQWLNTTCCWGQFGNALSGLLQAKVDMKSSKLRVGLHTIASLYVQSSVSRCASLAVLVDDYNKYKLLVGMGARAELYSAYISVPALYSSERIWVVSD